MPSTECDLRDRPPTGVWWSGGQCGYALGMGGVTNLRVVRIPGPMGFHPWIEVFKGDDLAARVNCCQVEEIRYDDN